MIKISVIMPLYNAEKYLEECLQSVLKQSFSQFELICINDASSDGTGKILENYANKDFRIKVFTNEKRSGAAYSRNRGIKEAVGEYLSFLDGDDIFDEAMLEAALVDAEKYQADIVVFNGKHVPSDRIHDQLYVVHGKEYIEKYCKNIFTIHAHEPYEFLNWQLGPWNKLYRKELILSENLEFQNLSCANDVYFVSMALMLARRIRVMDDSRVMVHVRDHFELSRISYNRDPMCTYQAVEKIIIELKKREKLASLYKQFYWSSAFAIINAITISKDKERARFVYDFLKTEGIKNLIELGGTYYQTVDAYVKELFDNFEEKTYESEWYRNESILKIYLAKNAELVEKLFRNYEDKGIKVGIWGAGRNGQTLIEFCDGHDIKVDTVIDKNKGGKGITLCGHKIYKFEECPEEVQTIIIASEYIYEDVEKSIEMTGKNIELIDINQILQIT